MVCVAGVRADKAPLFRVCGVTARVNSLTSCRKG